MFVTVKLYGNLKLYAPGKMESAQVEVEDGTRIRGLLERLGVDDKRVWMSAINDKVVDDSSELHDGDVLEVFEPVGGGMVTCASACCKLIQP
jgi:thiamine biosynthesis protein ThiS